MALLIGVGQIGGNDVKLLLVLLTNAAVLLV